jgi:hypothetical protein
MAIFASEEWIFHLEDGRSAILPPSLWEFSGGEVFRPAHMGMRVRFPVPEVRPCAFFTDHVRWGFGTPFQGGAEVLEDPFDDVPAERRSRVLWSREWLGVKYLQFAPRFANNWWDWNSSQSSPIEVGETTTPGQNGSEPSIILPSVSIDSTSKAALTAPLGGRGWVNCSRMAGRAMILIG